MQFFIILLFACAVFALCSAVFLLKARRDKGPPRLHRCGEGEACHCFGKSITQEPFNLVDLLEKASRGEGDPCPGQKSKGGKGS